MKVNIDIKEDEHFRKHVRDMISGQVRGILREELGGIVATELTKMRLLQPDSPTLSEMVTRHVNLKVAQMGDQITRTVRNQIEAAVREEARKHADSIKANIRTHMVEAIRLYDPK